MVHQKWPHLQSHVINGPIIHLAFTLFWLSFPQLGQTQVFITSPWYWLPVFTPPCLLRVRGVSRRTLKNTCHRFLTQIASWTPGTALVLPVFPSGVLGLQHISGPRILVFTLTFTEQLACPLKHVQGLADSNEGGWSPAVGKQHDILNVTAGLVCFKLENCSSYESLQILLRGKNIPLYPGNDQPPSAPLSQPIPLPHSHINGHPGGTVPTTNSMFPELLLLVGKNVVPLLIQSRSDLAADPYAHFPRILYPPFFFSA